MMDVGRWINSKMCFVFVWAKAIVISSLLACLWPMVIGNYVTLRSRPIYHIQCPTLIPHPIPTPCHTQTNPFLFAISLFEPLLFSPYPFSPFPFPFSPSAPPPLLLGIPVQPDQIKSPFCSTYPPGYQHRHLSVARLRIVLPRRFP